MYNGKKREQEVFSKAYVERENLSNIQVFPVPTDLENWIEIDFDPEFNYRGKVYDPSTGSFKDNLKVKKERALKLRKKAYTDHTDALFLEWQYDKTDASEKAWRDAVKAVKLKYPIN